MATEGIEKAVCSLEHVLISGDGLHQGRAAFRDSSIEGLLYSVVKTPPHVKNVPKGTIE